MGRGGTENEIPISWRRPPWIDLPGDVTANILQRLGAEEILKSAEKVCTTWWKVCLDPAMWRVVDLKNSSGDDLHFDAMCRCAVDRSQGQLTDLTIARFGDANLLNYVSHRSSHLRRLKLEIPFNISASVLMKAVKKLPLLEELHLIKVWPLDAERVEAIGISCPLLKSFTYEGDWETYEDDENGIALAIAKTMPNLHHLRLVVDGMKNEGLEAILDGCPHLESLDLSDSACLDLISKAVRKRCSEQIKFLRFPIEPCVFHHHDDTPDNEYNGYDYDYYEEYY